MLYQTKLTRSCRCRESQPFGAFWEGSRNESRQMFFVQNTSFLVYYLICQVFKGHTASFRGCFLTTWSDVHSADRDNAKNPASSVCSVGSAGMLIRIDNLITAWKAVAACCVDFWQRECFCMEITWSCFSAYSKPFGKLAFSKLNKKRSSFFHAALTAWYMVPRFHKSKDF